jgi:hypothetical protein
MVLWHTMRCNRLFAAEKDLEEEALVTMSSVNSILSQYLMMEIVCFPPLCTSLMRPAFTMSCNPLWQTQNTNTARTPNWILVGPGPPTDRKSQGCHSNFRKLSAGKPAVVARIDTKIMSALCAVFIPYLPHCLRAH